MQRTTEMLAAIVFTVGGLALASPASAQTVVGENNTPATLSGITSTTISPAAVATRSDEHCTITGRIRNIEPSGQTREWQDAFGRNRDRADATGLARSPLPGATIDHGGRIAGKNRDIADSVGQVDTDFTGATIADSVTLANRLNDRVVIGGQNHRGPELSARIRNIEPSGQTREWQDAFGRNRDRADATGLARSPLPGATVDHGGRIAGKNRDIADAVGQTNANFTGATVRDSVTIAGRRHPLVKTSGLNVCKPSPLRYRHQRGR